MSRPLDRSSGTSPTVWGRVYAGASLLWASALLLAALAAAEHWMGVASALSWLVYGVASWLCHQLPDRSFHLDSTPLPVCARCIGIYVGAAFAALGRVVPSSRPVTPRRARAWLAAAAAPALATLMYEWATGLMPSHLVRAASGVLLGGGVSGLIVAAINADRGNDADRGDGHRQVGTAEASEYT